MGRGGKRPGAGRKPGSISSKPLLATECVKPSGKPNTSEYIRKKTLQES